MSYGAKRSIQNYEVQYGINSILNAANSSSSKN